MNARRLAKLSTTVAECSEQIILTQGVRRRFPAESYWDANEQRFQCWNRALGLFKKDLEEIGGHRPWPALQIVVEEILFSEMLTRVWTAALSLSDRDENNREMDAILRAVWIGHLAARQQALQLILAGVKVNEPVAIKLDELRRKLERWTDLLLSRFAHLGDVSVYASDVDRVSEWSQEHSQNEQSVEDDRWSLLHASLLKTLAAGLEKQSANPDLNRQIAISVSSSLPEETVWSDFEETMSWLNRMTATASEMEELIDAYMKAST